MSVRPSGRFLVIFGDPFPDLPKLIKRKKDVPKNGQNRAFAYFLGSRFRIYQSLNAKKEGPKQSNVCFGRSDVINYIG